MNKVLIMLILFMISSAAFAYNYNSYFNTTIPIIMTMNANNQLQYSTASHKTDLQRCLKYKGGKACYVKHCLDYKGGQACYKKELPNE